MKRCRELRRVGLVRWSERIERNPVEEAVGEQVPLHISEWHETIDEPCET